MKIAIITETLSTHSGARAPIELAKNLSLSNKITLLAFSLAEKEIKDQLEKDGIKIVLEKPFAFPLSKWLSALKFIPYLRKQDVISFHGTLPSFLAAKISGVPIVKTYYGTQLDAYLERFLPNQKLSLKNRLANWLGNQIILIIEKINFGLSKEVVGISQYTAQEAKKLFGRKITFVYLGSDLPCILDTPDKITHTDTVTILSVSRLTPYKGFHKLIEVFKKISLGIPQMKLVIVGSAQNLSYLGYLRNLSRNSSNIQIFTDISEEELTRLYQKCDLYATCDRYLFFGLPIIEAAAFGKPALALNFCAANEIVLDGKTGLVAENLEEFKEKLVALVKDKKLRLTLGQNAQKRAEEVFVWTKTAGLYEEIFKRHAQVN